MNNLHTEQEKEELLKIAKLKYPIGTEFINANPLMNQTPKIVFTHNLYFQFDGICAFGMAYLYYDEKWATITKKATIFTKIISYIL